MLLPQSDQTPASGQERSAPPSSAHVDRRPHPRRAVRWPLLAALVLAALLVIGCEEPAAHGEESLPTATSESPGDAVATPSREPPSPRQPESAPSPEATPDPAPTARPTAAAGPRGPPVSGELRVTYLDVGQGDATLIQAPDATLLIDASRHDRSDVVPHRRRLGVEHIDVVAITHAHADQVGQLDRVPGQSTSSGDPWPARSPSPSPTRAGSRAHRRGGC